MAQPSTLTAVTDADRERDLLEVLHAVAHGLVDFTPEGARWHNRDVDHEVAELARREFLTYGVPPKLTPLGAGFLTGMLTGVAA